MVNGLFGAFSFFYLAWKIFKNRTKWYTQVVNRRFLGSFNEDAKTPYVTPPEYYKNAKIGISYSVYEIGLDKIWYRKLQPEFD